MQDLYSQLIYSIAQTLYSNKKTIFKYKIAEELDDSDLDDLENSGESENTSKNENVENDLYLADRNIEKSAARGLGKSIAEHILKKQFGDQISDDMKNSNNDKILKIGRIPVNSIVDKLAYFIGNKIYAIFRSQNKGQSAIDDAIQDLGEYIFTRDIDFSDYFNNPSEDVGRKDIPKWYKAIEWIMKLARKRSISAHRKGKHVAIKSLEQEYAELLYRQQHKRDIDEKNIIRKSEGKEPLKYQFVFDDSSLEDDYDDSDDIRDKIYNEHKSEIDVALQLSNDKAVKEAEDKNLEGKELRKYVSRANADVVSGMIDKFIEDERDKDLTNKYTLGKLNKIRTQLKNEWLAEESGDLSNDEKAKLVKDRLNKIEPRKPSTQYLSDEEYDKSFGEKSEGGEKEGGSQNIPTPEDYRYNIDSDTSVDEADISNIITEVSPDFIEDVILGENEEDPDKKERNYNKEDELVWNYYMGVKRKDKPGGKPEEYGRKYDYEFYNPEKAYGVFTTDVSKNMDRSGPFRDYLKTVAGDKSYAKDYRQTAVSLYNKSVQKGKPILVFDGKGGYILKGAKSDKKVTSLNDVIIRANERLVEQAKENLGSSGGLLGEKEFSKIKEYWNNKVGKRSEYNIDERKEVEQINKQIRSYMPPGYEDWEHADLKNRLKNHLDYDRIREGRLPVSISDKTIDKLKEIVGLKYMMMHGFGSNNDRKILKDKTDEIRVEVDAKNGVLQEEWDDYNERYNIFVELCDEQEDKDKRNEMLAELKNFEKIHKPCLEPGSYNYQDWISAAESAYLNDVVDEFNLKFHMENENSNIDNEGMKKVSCRMNIVAYALSRNGKFIYHG